ncbi:hypothetical protein M0Q97_09955 [Candidatus Dojkabacteria bacterium]|jgi:hypothetical protein|nr:hypothetical protein [Candidatus Dojkabacteria bacterium]
MKENVTLALFILMIVGIIIVFVIVFDNVADASNKYEIEQQKEKNKIDSINNESTRKINYIDSMYRVFENEKNHVIKKELYMCGY